MASATHTKQTYLVRIDLHGTPFAREYVEARTPEEALSETQARLDRDEVAADAVALQPLLDNVIERVEQGARYSLSFKHEDEDEQTFVPFGPVVLTDLDALRKEAEAQGAIRADGAIVLAHPFGETPDYETPLPWMSKADAARLAKYLGVPFGES